MEDLQVTPACSLSLGNQGGKYDRIQSGDPELWCNALQSVTAVYFPRRWRLITAPPLHHVASGGASTRCPCTCNKTIYMLANTLSSAQSAAVIWIMVLDLFSQIFTPLACSHISRHLAAAAHHSQSRTHASPVTVKMRQCCQVDNPACQYLYDRRLGLFSTDCRTKKVQQKLWRQLVLQSRHFVGSSPVDPELLNPESGIQNPN